MKILPLEVRCLLSAVWHDDPNDKHETLQPEDPEMKAQFDKVIAEFKEKYGNNPTAAVEFSQNYWDKLNDLKNNPPPKHDADYKAWKTEYSKVIKELESAIANHSITPETQAKLKHFDDKKPSHHSDFNTGGNDELAEKLAKRRAQAGL